MSRFGKIDNHCKCETDSDELVEFYKYCVYNNVKLLLLERGSEVSLLERERILFVDEDYDEFFKQ